MAAFAMNRVSTDISFTLCIAGEALRFNEQMECGLTFLPAPRIVSLKQSARFLVVLVLALFVGMSIVACSSPNENVIPFPQVELPVLQNLDDVDPELAEYLSIRHASAMQYPTSASERGRLAMAYDANGWYEAAIDIYDQAHTLDPFEFMWPYFASLLEASQGDFESALRSLSDALEIDSDYVAAWLAKGTWLLQMDRFDEATIAFERAYAIDGNRHAIIGKAHVFVRRGDSRSAIDLLEPLSRRTLHPFVHRLLARAYEDLGMSEESRVSEAIGKKEGYLIWQDPLLLRRDQHIRGFGGRLSKAQRLLQARRVEEALVELTALRETYTERPALVSTLAWAYSTQGNTDLAIEALQIGIEEHPDHQPFYTQLGDLLSMTGSFDVALGLLEKSVELNPLDAEAHFKLGYALMQLGAMDEAVSSFEKALEFGSVSAPQIYIHLGTIAGYRRDWNEAIAHFKKTIDLDPRNVVGHERLCVVYIEAGKFDELDTALEWAAKLAIPDEEFEFVRQYRDEVLANPQ